MAPSVVISVRLVAILTVLTSEPQGALVRTAVIGQGHSTGTGYGFLRDYVNGYTIINNLNRSVAEQSLGALGLPRTAGTSVTDSVTDSVTLSVRPRLQPTAIWLP